MNDSALAKFYHTYLHDRDSARFIQRVASLYDNATLGAIAKRGDFVHRRAAVMALCFLGNYADNPTLGSALRDSDRGVRMIAEQGIQTLWMSVGTVGQRHQLRVAERYIDESRYAEALEITSRVCEAAPDFGEARRMYGVANFGAGNIRDALHDFRIAMRLNNYQFQAATGLANCHVRLGSATGGLRWFRRALRINPNLELVRTYIRRLRRSIEQS